MASSRCHRSCAPARGDLVARLRARTSEGAPGTLGLERVAARVDAERAAWQERQQRFTAAIAALTQGTSENEVCASTGAATAAQPGGFAADGAIAYGI